MTFEELAATLSHCNKSHSFYSSEIQHLDEFELPEIIEIEPIHFCNFNCIMCHVHFEGKLSRKKLDLDLLADRLSHPAFKNKWLLVASGYEGTAHPDFSKFINRVSDDGMKIELTTNGSLLTDDLISEISNTNLKYVTFSFDGMRKSSYEYIRGGANYEQTLERIGRFRGSLVTKDTYFNVNYTMMKRNIEEILDAVKYWDEISLDQIYFIAMRVRPGGGKHERETLENILEHVNMRLDEAALDVINNNRKITLASPFYKRSSLASKYPSNILHHIVRSDNPDARAMLNPRAYYQNGEHPGMPVGCRSPFKFMRIDYNGDVFLCQKFKIGNIAENDLIDIWNSEIAQKIRRRVQNTPGPCDDCDHYNLCVKADELNPDKENSLRQTVPELVGTHLDYSIVKIKEQLYGLPSEVIYNNAPIAPGTQLEANTIEELTALITQRTLNRK
jgi:radical SAM protein with 4Fe4S-binding SPASM domain